ncbi:MAG: hypothetical protein MJE77_14595 [Proteobacteria bacterium]|nr:hypothetical protein [Pseudomonadota bacterium]
MDGTNRTKPLVLILDDRDEVHTLDGAEELSVRVLSPNDLDAGDLDEAKTVLIDFNLDDWQERDNLPYCARPKNGLALAAIVREHLRDARLPPAAIALITGQMQQLAPGYSHPRPNLVARAHGLEWAFYKSAAPDDLKARVTSLTRAVDRLPRKWPSQLEGIKDEIDQFLGIPDQEWAAHAWASLEECRPPLHELRNWTDGMALIRWLLHRILPYPCFLWGMTRLALRLHVQPRWLKNELEPAGQLYEVFAPYLYRGALQGFDGPRWWGAGIDDLLRDQLNDHSSSHGATHEWLKQYAATPVAALDCFAPTMIINEYFEPGLDIYEMDQCVQIQPDDWPAYADPAWTTLELANEHRELGELVTSAHRYRLDEE